ncbi:hypothetical protein OD91_1272 [Lutibacter sp. Hel_I_33_5]|nr:hypothetical protein OD91_1272 [Lutibacter sp. Hel_I_33_5]
MVCVFSFFITSCEQNETIEAPQTTTKVAKKRLFKAAKAAVSKSKRTPSTSNNNHAAKRIASIDCFAYVFPITIKNGEEETVINSKEELADYYDAVEIGSEPEIVFPITIKLEDNSEETITNLEELDDVYDSCMGEETPCYTLNYPLSLVQEDFTTNTSNETVINSEIELHTFIDMAFDKDENAHITFKYPLELTLSDGSISTIENDDDFDAIDSYCYNYDDCEDYDEFDCFEVQFPIKANLNGEEITINSNDDLEEYISKLEDYTFPDFVFPIDIKYTDDTLVTLNSLEELEDAFDDCFYEEDDDTICFDITYPINLVKNEDTENTVTVNNDQEFDAYLDSLIEDDYLYIGYPLTVILQDGTKKTIADDDEFIALEESCDN